MSDNQGEPISYSSIDHSYFAKKSGTKLMTNEYIYGEEHDTWSGTPNE